jgi:murein DD-endopeptidase MepM/ murein hydrolase activator NlpD
MTTRRRAALVGIIGLTILLGSMAPGGASTAGAEPPKRQWSTGGYGWPLDPPITVLRGFDPPPEPWLAGHRGVDLAARPGQAVRAAGSGVVTFAGPIAGRNVVVIRLTSPPAGRAPDGPAATASLRITYEPVRPRLHRGGLVHTGQVVGRLQGGVRHCGVLGSCLHWGLRRGDSYLDPLLLVQPRRIRLLPLDRDLAPDPWPGLGIWSTGATQRIGQPPGTWPAALARPVVSGLSQLARAIVAASHRPP